MKHLYDFENFNENKLDGELLEEGALATAVGTAALAFISLFGSAQANAQGYYPQLKDPTTNTTKADPKKEIAPVKVEDSEGTVYYTDGGLPHTFSDDRPGKFKLVKRTYISINDTKDFFPKKDPTSIGDTLYLTDFVRFVVRTGKNGIQWRREELRKSPTSKAESDVPGQQVVLIKNDLYKWTPVVMGRAKMAKLGTRAGSGDGQLPKGDHEKSCNPAWWQLGGFTGTHATYQ
jgi:hypothetical protein